MLVFFTWMFNHIRNPTFLLGLGQCPTCTWPSALGSEGVEEKISSNMLIVEPQATGWRSANSPSLRSCLKPPLSSCHVSVRNRCVTLLALWYQTSLAGLWTSFTACGFAALDSQYRWYLPKINMKYVWSVWSVCMMCVPIKQCDQVSSSLSLR